MRLNRWNRSALLASVALVPLPFASARAVERSLFTWSSVVDKEVVIQVHGRDVFTRGGGLDASISPRLNLNQPLPRESGVLRVHLESGRGDVEVLENPSARNDYTGTVRIRDPRGGADQYRMTVTFDADNNGDVGQGDRNGNRNHGNRDGKRNNGNRDGSRNKGNRDGDRDGEGGGYRDGDRNDRGGNDRGGYDRDESDRDHSNDRGWYDRNRRDAGALRWHGLVDAVAEIRIRGNRVEAFSSQGQRLRDVQYDVFGAALPRRDVRVVLVGDAGRGRVQITQQPSAWNGFTAVIRIEDPRGGYGAYDFDVRW